MSGSGVLVALGPVVAARVDRRGVEVEPLSSTLVIAGDWIALVAPLVSTSTEGLASRSGSVGLVAIGSMARGGAMLSRSFASPELVADVVVGRRGEEVESGIFTLVVAVGDWISVLASISGSDIEALFVLTSSKVDSKAIAQLSCSGSTCSGTDGARSGSS